MNERKMYSLDKLKNSYLKLESRKPPTDQEFVIYAYFLYSEPKDGVHGKQIFLGAYPTKKKALIEVAEIIKKTDHDSIYMCESCSWNDIDEVVRVDRTFHLDPTQKVRELETSFEDYLEQKFQKQDKIEEISKELDKEQKQELDPTSLEHYVHNWFLTIKNKSEYEYHKERAEHFEKMYNMRSERVQKQYTDNPSIDNDWLGIYEKKLERRGEKELFSVLKQGYMGLRKMILG